MSRILMCTGIFPPQVGGPAQYAKEIADEFRREGHSVKVLTFALEHSLPPLLRHKLFFWRVFFSLLPGLFVRSKSVDFLLILDTFSVGWPAVWGARIFGKKTIIRTGGDFLWESYVERTGDLVPLGDFYEKSRNIRARFNFKEKIIFSATRRTLRHASALIFSTDWQRIIFENAYKLDPQKNFIVENFYGPKLLALLSATDQVEQRNRSFVAGSRKIKLKNFDRLTEAFAVAQKTDPTISLDLSQLPHAEFIREIQKSYAVILVSISDISPNMILDAIRTNTPFIVTKHTGLFEKLKNVALFVDPENVAGIAEKIVYLSDAKNYALQKQKIESFTFTHSWEEICHEILAISEKINE